MRRYAEDTKVPVNRSRDELERTLTRFGADQFAYGREGRNHVIGFRVKGRYVRIDLEVPRAERPRDTYSASIENAADPQEERRMWRSLVLVVKAKLEAVNSGISTVEAEFLNHIVLPDGKTVGQWIRPQLTEVYQQGTMPQMLPYYGEANAT